MYLVSTFGFNLEAQKKLKSVGIKFKIFNSEKELIDSNDMVDADIIIANHRTLQIEFLDRCKKLKWIQVAHIGIERLPMQYLKDRNVIVTNTRGAAGVPIAEDIFCQMLMIARKSKECVKNQFDHQWGRLKGVFSLYGKTVGVLGAGDVGREVAKRAKAFGMKTLGLNTSGQPVEFFDEIYKTSEINELIAQSDFIVNTIPPTDITTRLVDREQFEHMKPSAYILNISRAFIFNEEVLYEYLKDKKIAGAALDVFMDEFYKGFLPADSPFWDLDNLLITPHMAAAGDFGGKKSLEIIMHNMECFVNGKINEMFNIRDYSKGY